MVTAFKFRITLRSARTGKKLTGAVVDGWRRRNIDQFAQGFAEYAVELGKRGKALWQQGILSASPRGSKASFLLGQSDSPRRPGTPLTWTRTYHDSIDSPDFSVGKVKRGFKQRRNGVIFIGPGLTGRTAHPGFQATKDLQLIALIHENGASIPVTERVKKFFAARGVPIRKSVIQIPARPVLDRARRKLLKEVNKIFKNNSGTMVAQMDIF